jgi:hypothetical protein
LSSSAFVGSISRIGVDRVSSTKEGVKGLPGARAASMWPSLTPWAAPSGLRKLSYTESSMPRALNMLLAIETPINLVILHPGKGLADLPLARAQRLHLRAVQHDARLEGVEDVIVSPGFGIAQNVRHKIDQAGETSQTSRDTDLTPLPAPIPPGGAWSRPGSGALMLLALLRHRSG